MGLGRPPNEPLFESNDPRSRALFTTPAIVRAYWRAFSDLVNGPFNNETLDPFVDAHAAALVKNNVNIDPAAVTAIKTFVTERRAFLQAQLATVAAPFAVDGPTSLSTANNLLVFTGSAPVGVKDITLNGLVYPITWTTVTNFLLRLVVEPGINSITLQGLDRFGVPINGASQVLSVEYTGPASNPFGALVISEIMSTPAASGAQF